MGKKSRLGLLRRGLARILVVGLPRAKRPIVPRRTRRSVHMLILSGRLTSIRLAGI